MTNLRLLLAVSIALTLTAGAAQARQKHRPAKESRVLALLEKLVSDNEKMRKELAAFQQRFDALNPPLPLPRAASSNPVLAIAPMPVPDVSKTIAGYADQIAKSAKVKDLALTLRGKVAEILSTCPGSKIVSAYRPGARVAGSGRPSLHSRFPSEAADLAGNYACIYAKLKHWAGGYSIDPQAVRHVHISMAHDRRERGARFAHYGTRQGYAGLRYARHERYAEVH